MDNTDWDKLSKNKKKSYRKWKKHFNDYDYPKIFIELLFKFIKKFELQVLPKKNNFPKL